MDIQVGFKTPTKITQSVSEPDGLKVKFKNNAMFMDEVEFE